MILHPVISDIAARREALTDAIRKGHLTYNYGVPRQGTQATVAYTTEGPDTLEPCRRFAMTKKLSADLPRLYATGKYKQAELSRRFEISPSMVCSILNGKIRA